MAIQECGGDKALGSDGFNFAFIRAAWDALKKDFCEMLCEFHRRGRLSKEIHATFLALIPKISNPVELRDFRPISLVGCVYKVLAKVLSNRLKVALPHIIGTCQGAFVHNRQILDNVLISNELINSRKRSKKGGVIVKIDMEKGL